jgi:hypothetical protein
MRTFRLPLLVTPDNKLAVTLIVAALTVTLYAVSGRVALLLEPSVLSMTSWDSAIPLVPWTFWVYVSVYVTYFASCFLQRDLERFGRFVCGYLLSYVMAAVFFVVYPTTFPRDDFPLPSGAGELTRACFTWFRSLDAPTNCLPSMHVATAVMSSLPFHRRRPLLFAAFCAWSLAIALTTLTTKQHYVVSGALRSR